MKEPLNDTTAILAILCTLLVVFSLIFSFNKPSSNSLDPSIQWRNDLQENSSNYNFDLNQVT